jgi:hypothetical protein
MLHPARYSAAIVLGGYFQPDFGTLYDPFRPGSAAWHRYDLVALAAQHPPAVALWVQTSRADRLSFPTTAELLARARPPLSVQSLVMEHAGHRTDVWLPLLPQTLAWLGAEIPGFAPARPSPPTASAEQDAQQTTRQTRRPTTQQAATQVSPGARMGRRQGDGGAPAGKTRAAGAPAGVVPAGTTPAGTSPTALLPAGSAAGSSTGNPASGGHAKVNQAKQAIPATAQ